MKRKNNRLKPYLIISLIINLIILISSCKDVFFDQYGEFYFVNETNYAINIEARSGLFNVAARSTTIFKEDGRGEGKKSAISNYSSPLRHYSKELNIKFDNAKCLIDVKENDEHSIRDIKNFTAVKIGENHYKFTYTFTEADYNRAVTCP